MFKKEPTSIPSATPAATPPAPKKSNWVRYTLIMLGFALLGAVCGFAFSFAADNIGSAGRAFATWLVTVLPWLQWGTFALLTVAALVAYALARRQTVAVEKSDGENEALSERADVTLGLAMLLGQLEMILTYFWFGLAIVLNKTIFTMLSGVLLILGVIIFQSAFNVHCVRLTKRLYPSKQGDPLDFRFQKDWFGSMDEAELMGVYQAAWISHKVTNYTILGCWVVTVLLGMFADIGPLPILLVTVIWLASSMSYLISCIKQDKRKSGSKSNQAS